MFAAGLTSVSLKIGPWTVFTRLSIPFPAHDSSKITTPPTRHIYKRQTLNHEREIKLKNGDVLTFLKGRLRFYRWIISIAKGILEYFANMRYRCGYHRKDKSRQLLHKDHQDKLRQSISSFPGYSVRPTTTVILAGILENGMSSHRKLYQLFISQSPR